MEYLEQMAINHVAQIKQSGDGWSCQSDKSTGYGGSRQEALGAWWTVLNNGRIGVWNDER